MSHALKAWYVIDAYTGPNAGSEKQLFLLASRMVELGHEVRLFVLRDTAYTRSGPAFPCPIESLGIGSLRSLSSLNNMLAFRRRIRQERPNIVHAWFNDAAIMVPLFCGQQGARIFTSRRDMGFWHTPSYLAILKLANRRVDGIICNSRAVARLTARREGVPEARIAVIHNGISAEHPVTGSVTGRGPAPGSARLPIDGFNVCLVANLRPVKRVEDFILAAAIVSKSIPAARFWIAGESLDEDYARALRSRVAELGLDERIHFLGESDDPLGLMRQCQAGVLCSESEGLSNTLLEYLLCGLPAVCSDVGGNPELVENGVNGFLYPCGNIEQLAAGLTRLAGDPALRRAMAEAARLRAAEHTVDSMCRAHLAVYQGA